MNLTRYRRGHDKEKGEKTSHLKHVDAVTCALTLRKKEKKPILHMIVVVTMLSWFNKLVSDISV